MNAEFGYFVDHLPSIIGAIFAGFVLLRQAGTKTTIARIDKTTEATRTDIRNGIGEKIATKVVEHVGPGLEVVVSNATDKAADRVEQKASLAATIAADKIEQKATEVAAKLAEWDGTERRSGVDRRQP